VGDDAGGVRQRVQVGEVGGLAAEWRRCDTRHHVRPGRRCPRALVRLLGHAAHDEPERQRGRGGRDRQQEEGGLGRAAAQVAGGEAADE
jgi:hypothetical protein